MTMKKKKLSLGLAYCSLFLVVVAAPTVYGLESFTAQVAVRTISTAEEEQRNKHEAKRHLLETSHAEIGSRLLQKSDSKDGMCDAAFTKCLQSDKCVNCFLEMNSDDLDWASVTPQTQCSVLLDIVFSAKHCLAIRSDAAAQDLLCSTFDSCVLDPPSPDGKKPEDITINCNELTECQWSGKHDQFIGDGVCHAHMDGCYNTAICNWDGGDCCPDTCHTNSSYVECGHDGWWCLNPDAKACDVRITPLCKNATDPDTVPDIPECEAGTTPYRLVMYDSFGDGWDETVLNVNEKGSGMSVFKGHLEKGSTGTEYLCLSTSAKCYQVQAAGGVWGNEVSWEVKPLTEGASRVAGGGSPQTCDFAIAGDNCPTTCEGPPKIQPDNDPDYRDFKEMYNCITSKCKVQVAECEKDDTCKTCFKDSVEQYCYSDLNFNGLADCTLCKCTDSKDAEFCEKKMAPDVAPYKPSVDPASGGTIRPPCSPQEKMMGSSAVLQFAQCTSMDQVSMLVTDFDQNHFGGLDKFEACAHAFRDNSTTAHVTALGCMQLLVNTANNKTAVDEETPQNAVAALSNLLYKHAGEFCPCASNASAACPLCPDFVNFKTLLYESVDACNSLDEIDCNAWDEYATLCRPKMEGKFGTINFQNTAQCEYISEGCENVGPFPAFRKLDCGKELAAAQWGLYLDYARGCLKENPPDPAPTVKPPTPAPPAPSPDAPTPVTPPVPTPYQPTPYQPTPYEPPSDKKPYVPPNDKKAPSRGGSSSGSKSHWFRNTVILALFGGAGYMFWKRRSEFSFYRYRGRGPRNYGMADDGMLYSGLTMEASQSGSSTFQPPTLPPTPQAIGGDQYYS